MDWRELPPPPPGSGSQERVLVLGESHYGGGYEHDATQAVVGHIVEMLSENRGLQRGHTFFLKAARVLLLNRHATRTECAEAFQRVAFYNYVQDWMDVPRHRPSEEQWARANGPFEVVLDGLKPDRVLVLGQAVWWHVRNAPAFRNIKGRAGFITHPSGRGFKYDVEIPRWQEVLTVGGG